MASQAAYKLDKAIGKDDNAILEQDISNYAKVGDPDVTMKALAWAGKGKVEISMAQRLTDSELQV